MSGGLDVTAGGTLVIVNERAGAGAMADHFRRVEHALEDGIGPFDLAFTDGPGHATELNRMALHGGVARVVVGGGDGTIHEVVNGFFDEVSGHPLRPDAVLALLGGGTGGDFRTSVGLASSEDAIEALIAGRTRAIDVGRVTLTSGTGGPRRHFVNIGSFGFSGRIMETLGGHGAGALDRFVPALKALGGHAAHFGATLHALVGWRNVAVRLAFDGGPAETRAVVTVAVGNGRYFGGGMRICPDAELDSGVLDVTVLGDLTKLELLSLTRAIYDGTHVRHPGVTRRRVRVLEASPADDSATAPVTVELDGEVLGPLPARFEVLPNALRLAVPA